MLFRPSFLVALIPLSNLPPVPGGGYSCSMKPSMDMTRRRRTALVWLLLCCGISVFWGSSIERVSPYGLFDFRGIYYYARCLLQHSDPYKTGEPLRVYLADGGVSSGVLPDILSLNMYLPTSFIISVPFAMLPWGPAHIFWMAFIAGSLFLAAFLMWNLAGDSSPGISLFLICFVLANSEILMKSGNPAAIAVGLCVMAAWCFLEERFVPAGILFLAVSLAIKPHDSGLVWLYFLLAGGVYRKRALQTLALTVALSLPAVLWVTSVAPHWMQELRSNLQAASAPGGPLDLGPDSAISGSCPSMIINLQSTISAFRNDPRFYNSVSYLVCGTLLLIGAIHTLRARISRRGAWLALAAVVPLTMLVTYHRCYDAKLLLLTVPACAMLWAEGGPLRWIALLVNTAGIVFTSDIPLEIISVAVGNRHVATAGLSAETLTAVLLRPTPLILLAMGIFYLWVYLRREPERG